MGEEQGLPETNHKNDDAVNEFTRLEVISNKLSGIQTKLSQKNSGGDQAIWFAWIILGILLILITQIKLNTIIQITHATPVSPTEVSPTEVSPTEVSPTEVSPTEVSPTEVTGLSSTLLDWLRESPRHISVVRKDNIEGVISIPGGYIVRFNQDELKNNLGTDLNGNIRIEISFENPGNQVSVAGCFVIKVNDEEKDKNCKFELGKPVQFDIAIPFAIQDLGQTTVCDPLGRTLGFTHYKDIKDYQISVEWAKDSSDTSIPLEKIQLTSNLVVLNKESEASDQGTLTNCEAVIVDSINSQKDKINVARINNEFNISVNNFILSDELRFWLGIQ